MNKQDITTSKEASNIGEVTKKHRKSQKSTEINKGNHIIKGYYPQMNQT